MISTSNRKKQSFCMARRSGKNNFLPRKYFFDVASSCFRRHEMLFRATSTCFCRYQITFCATSNLFQYKIIFRETSSLCFGHCYVMVIYFYYHIATTM